MIAELAKRTHVALKAGGMRDGRPHSDVIAFDGVKTSRNLRK